MTFQAVSRYWRIMCIVLCTWMVGSSQKFHRCCNDASKTRTKPSQHYYNLKQHAPSKWRITASSKHSLRLVSSVIVKNEKRNYSFYDWPGYLVQQLPEVFTSRFLHNIQKYPFSKITLGYLRYLYGQVLLTQNKSLFAQRSKLTH